jgi:hypothetical protein
MAKAKKIVRREWTKADVKQLKTMAKARVGVTKISKSLKRTPGATSVMAAKLACRCRCDPKCVNRTGPGTVHSRSQPVP